MGIGKTGHEMQPPDAGRCRVIQRPLDIRLQCLEPSGKRRDTALASRPVARRQVEQGLLQIVAGKPFGDRLRRGFIGKEIFDGGKAGIGRGVVRLAAKTGMVAFLYCFSGSLAAPGNGAPESWA